MATYDITLTTPSTLANGDILNCPYSGTYKTLTLPKGVYKLECWGAKGGDVTYYPTSYNYIAEGGKGGYSTGVLTLNSSTTIYLYVGGKGTSLNASTGIKSGGYNGGGSGYCGSTTTPSAGGGGASDIRIASTSLYARVIVAGGGGSAGGYNDLLFSGGNGGGVEGGTSKLAYSSSCTVGYGGSQTARGNSYYGTTANSTTYGNLASFGTGGSYKSTSYGVTGGGGGWYGGGYSFCEPAGGGSGYIYTSSTTSNYPSGCTLNSNYYLKSASLSSGNDTFPSTIIGKYEKGHDDNGYIRITVINTDLTIFASSKLPFRCKINEEFKQLIGYVKVNGNWKTISKGYTKVSGLWKPDDTMHQITYIESNGTQCINTGIKLYDSSPVNYKIDIKFIGYSIGSDLSIFINAMKEVSPYPGVVLREGTVNGTKCVLWNGHSGNTNVNKGALDLTLTLSLTYNNSSTTHTVDTTLFAGYASSGSLWRYSNMRLYYCKITKNGVLVRDFIPVRIGQTGYLYDLISGQLFENIGTGNFILGSDV